MSMSDRLRKHIVNPNTNSGVVLGPQWKPEKSQTYRLDFLPYKITQDNHPDSRTLDTPLVIGEQWFRRPYAVHRMDSIKRTVVCPLGTFGQPCSLCVERQKLYADGYENNKHLIDELKAKKKALYNVAVGGDFSRVLIYDGNNYPYSKMTPTRSFGEMLEYEVKNNSNEDVVNFAMVKGGYSVACRFDEKAFGQHPYFLCNNMSFSKRDDIAPEVMMLVHPLDDCLKPTTTEDTVELLAMVLRGVGVSETSERPRENVHRYEPDEVPDDFKPQDWNSKPEGAPTSWE
jgi:hypothetical protein